MVVSLFLRWTLPGGCPRCRRDALRFAVAMVDVVGRVRGGLAHVTVVASMIFSGMSGSAIADAAGPGKLMIEMMLKEGRYKPGFAGALAAAAATMKSGTASSTKLRKRPFKDWEATNPMSWPLLRR